VFVSLPVAMNRVTAIIIKTTAAFYKTKEQHLQNVLHLGKSECHLAINKLCHALDQYAWSLVSQSVDRWVEYRSKLYSTCYDSEGTVFVLIQNIPVSISDHKCVFYSIINHT